MMSEYESVRTQLTQPEIRHELPCRLHRGVSWTVFNYLAIIKDGVDSNILNKIIRPKVFRALKEGFDE